MKKLFRGTSLENCLQLARCELKVPEDKELNYKILEDKKLFFRKRVVIEVLFEDEIQGQTNFKEDYKINKNEGTVKVVGGKLIVKDPLEGGKPAVIRKGKNMSFFIDGVLVEKGCEVFSSSNIVVNFEQNEPKRQMDIYVSDDSMEAYVKVTYIPENVYALGDSKEGHMINLDAVIVKTINPPKYTAEDIKNELSNNKIIYGIIEENLENTIKINKKVLVAKGKKPVDGQDDFIDVKFQNSVDFKQDKKGNVDFKSIGTINAVKKGDIIAEIHKGYEGENGFDVRGKLLKCKKGNAKKLKAGKGCIIKAENTVEAVVDGKPFIKNGVFHVHPVHEINKDVDLSTGNIKFTGDVVVQGNIREGMEVECGDNLIVYKEVERSKVKANGDILIKGSIVGSDIYGGGDCVDKIKSLDYLAEFNKNLEELIKAVKEIKTYDLLGENRKDGEIIKVLLENKFKVLVKLGVNIITDLNMESDECEENTEKEIVEIIRTKLMGIGPISITNYLELEDLNDKVKYKIQYLKNSLALPVDVTISYCQDSHIESSGNIIITGEGEYVSEITANGSIEFLQEKSVARGGVLKAKKAIKCKIVGSMAGVSTILQVENEGHIWADAAYHNTVFKVGKRKVMLDSPSKDVHVYIENNNIIVDKFLL
ncbi:DUF342 domain-containing protein [Clostridium sp. WILCCON 0269]|uniref:DUF342 domain-containing protein n=1 Tax=Candidatus Clostridium eludens TaxID=3381663 RepID=A0ABW8SN32_9CLOT